MQFVALTSFVILLYCYSLFKILVHHKWVVTLGSYIPFGKKILKEDSLASITYSGVIGMLQINSV